MAEYNSAMASALPGIDDMNDVVNDASAQITRATDWPAGGASYRFVHAVAATAQRFKTFSTAGVYVGLACRAKLLALPNATYEDYASFLGLGGGSGTPYYGIGVDSSGFAFIGTAVAATLGTGDVALSVGSVYQFILWLFADGAAPEAILEVYDYTGNTLIDTVTGTPSTLVGGYAEMFVGAVSGAVGASEIDVEVTDILARVGTADYPLLPIRPRVMMLSPNADGTYTQWTASAGNDYECVDDADIPHNNDTDYISTASGNYKALFTTPSCGLTDETLYGVEEVAYAKKGTTNYLKMMRRLGGTDYFDATYWLPGATYEFRRRFWGVDPAGNPWSIANVDALENGVFHYIGSGAARCTVVRKLVCYDGGVEAVAVTSVPKVMMF